MILAAEIALVAIALYALITGQLPTNKKSKHVVQGLPARLIGAIGFMPLPLSFVVGASLGLLLGFLGKEVAPQSLFWIGTAIEGSIVLLCVITMRILARAYRVPILSSSPAAVATVEES
jgi:hypothetical protein